MRQFILLITVLCLTLVALTAAAAELVDNPEYLSWARYKPGTSVTWSFKIKVGTIDLNQDLTQTLKEVTPDVAIVEMVDRNSQKPTTKTLEIASKVLPKESETTGLPAGFSGEYTSVGKETIQVGDRKFETQVRQCDGKNSRGMPTQGKTWATLEVPSCMVKMELTIARPNEHAAMSVLMTLSSFNEVK